MRSRRSMRPRQHAIATYVPLIKWQTAEIEAGLAELDAGQTVSQETADERYVRLLKRRQPIRSSRRAE
jgi:predicted transcriptional regulator